jgi:hypothetical protein
METYGQFIGDWIIAATFFNDDGSETQVSGEIHFGWVLEGRAIQDVWIVPDYFFGTTLRVYDPDLDAWHILWSDPLRQRYNRQIGRTHDNDIVQEGHDGHGEATRWSFVDITTKSFRWLGERKRPHDDTWRLLADFSVTRASIA